MFLTLSHAYFRHLISNHYYLILSNILTFVTYMFTITILLLYYVYIICKSVSVINHETVLCWSTVA